MDIRAISFIVLLIVAYFAPLTFVITEIEYMPFLLLGITSFIIGLLLGKKIKEPKDLTISIFAINFFALIFLHLIVLPSGSIGWRSVVAYGGLLFGSSILGLLIMKIKLVLAFFKKNWKYALSVLVLVLLLLFLWAKTDWLVLGDQYDKQIHKCLVQNPDAFQQHSCIVSVAREVYRFDQARGVALCAENSPIAILAGKSFETTGGSAQATCILAIVNANSDAQQLTESQKRDLQRKRDMEWMSKRFLKYADEIGSFPEARIPVRSNDAESYHNLQKILSAGLGDADVVFLDIDPMDPERYYQYTSDGASFTLTAAFENESSDCQLVSSDVCIFTIERDVTVGNN